eukprot:m.2522 g.2522  ORF g.2522 m.2522 type:complete len:104 (+) comp1815_c0_seq2:582-893(+)
MTTTCNSGLSRFPTPLPVWPMFLHPLEHSFLYFLENERDANLTPTPPPSLAMFLHKVFELFVSFNKNPISFSLKNAEEKKGRRSKLAIHIFVCNWITVNSLKE